MEELRHNLAKCVRLAGKNPPSDRELRSLRTWCLSMAHTTAVLLEQRELAKR